VLVGVVVAVTPSTRKGGESGATSPATSSIDNGTLQKVDRKGYADLDEDGIVDPAPLVEQGRERAVRQAGAPVIPACNLLSFADLKKLGLLLHPNPLPGGVKRSYFDGQGTGRIDMSSDLFLPSAPPNSCQYMIRPEGFVDIQLSQSSYTNPGAMQYMFTKYLPRPALGRVSVAQQNDRDTEITVYTLRLGKTLALVNLKPGNDAKFVRPVLKTIAANLERQSSGPTGLAKLGFDSPLLGAGSAVACSLYGADDFRSIFGKPASPYVEDEIGTAVGVTNFSINTTIPDTRDYAYTATTCRRVAVQGDSYGRFVLELEVTSYQADAAPKHSMDFSSPLDGGVPLKQTVGEGAYCVTRKYARSDGALLFRQGRFLVTLTMYGTKQKLSGTPESRCERLVPLARRVAERLT
jgi:hypothetical protein